jgi:uncharacterized protein (TIGR02145 family)
MKKCYFISILAILLTSNPLAQPGFEPDTIFVSAGWNLIGSRYAGAVSDIVTTEPPGILASPFYSFSVNGGYSAADTLKKSKGYWVKISQQQSDGPSFIIVAVPPLPWTCGSGLWGRIWYGGKWYYSVQIGSQCWLKSNLNIGNRINGTVDQTDNGVIEKYCYGDDESNCETFGGLYQWREAMQYDWDEGTQGICPNGWHIPTWGELNTLDYNVGHDGNSLKAIGQGTGAGAGTNTSKFSALLAGQQSYGSYSTIGSRGKFWSSSHSTVDYAYYINLFDFNNNIDIDFVEWNFYALSIRCIKN